VTYWVGRTKRGRYRVNFGGDGIDPSGQNLIGVTHLLEWSGKNVNKRMNPRSDVGFRSSKIGRKVNKSRKRLSGKGGVLSCDSPCTKILGGSSAMV